eukprot:GAHX01000860.1.p2 GENE.GAHX01000860.1~~GAHX01000860.1.p2  ORF type:complete len:200 (-),score=31.50 GAHX01000860.1:363-962(-)
MFPQRSRLPCGHMLKLLPEKEILSFIHPRWIGEKEKNLFSCLPPDNSQNISNPDFNISNDVPASLNGENVVPVVKMYDESNIHVNKSFTMSPKPKNTIKRNKVPKIEYSFNTLNILTSDFASLFQSKGISREIISEMFESLINIVSDIGIYDLLKVIKEIEQSIEFNNKDKNKKIVKKLLNCFLDPKIRDKRNDKAINK